MRCTQAQQHLYLLYAIMLACIGDTQSGAIVYHCLQRYLVLLLQLTATLATAIPLLLLVLSAAAHIALQSVAHNRYNLTVKY
jgi:hypothetical protein